MYHFDVVHLIHFFFLPERKRSVELCKRDNKACLQDYNLQQLSKKNKLPFKLLKPQFTDRILPN